MNSPLGGNRPPQDIEFLQKTSQASVNMIAVIFDFLISKSENPEQTKKELTELVSKHSSFDVNSFAGKAIKLLK